MAARMVRVLIQLGTLARRSTSDQVRPVVRGKFRCLNGRTTRRCGSVGRTRGGKTINVHPSRRILECLCVYTLSNGTPISRGIGQCFVSGLSNRKGRLAVCKGTLKTVVLRRSNGITRTELFVRSLVRCSIIASRVKHCFSAPGTQCS